MGSFMESGQCMEEVPGATITRDLCLQSHEQITNHIQSLAKKTSIHHVFIASDVDPRLSYIKKKLGTAVSIILDGAYLICMISDSSASGRQSCFIDTYLQLSNPHSFHVVHMH